MGQEIFRAGVQYNDFTGTAAADRHDHRAIDAYLSDNGLLQENETVLGVEMWSGEVHSEKQDRPVYVTAHVVKLNDHSDQGKDIEAGPLHVRRIELEMHLDEFFGLFKRFAVCISVNGGLDGRTITYE